jgi:NAD(P)-dependent dehydrogenase (short-subunit alcohol dehydrogenase family)
LLPELALTDRTAIVTGAGRGIGKAIALVLAEAGADVVVAARTLSEVEAAAKQVRALGRQALAVRADITDSADADSLVTQALERFGKVDILVNNAGQIVKLPVVPFPDEVLVPPRVTRRSDSAMTDEEWQRIIDVNLNGVFYCCRAVAPHMIDRKYGKIINISSVYDKLADPMVSSYNASKAGVAMLTRVLALEWAPYNICVNGIGPGAYRTPINTERWDDPDERRRILDAIPMGREGDTRELGILAAYLASPATDYMTGQIIYMDGGRSAK